MVYPRAEEDRVDGDWGETKGEADKGKRAVGKGKKRVDAEKAEDGKQEEEGEGEDEGKGKKKMGRPQGARDKPPRRSGVRKERDRSSSLSEESQEGDATKARVRRDRGRAAGAGVGVGTGKRKRESGSSVRIGEKEGDAERSEAESTPVSIRPLYLTLRLMESVEDEAEAALVSIGQLLTLTRASSCHGDASLARHGAPFQSLGSTATDVQHVAKASSEAVEGI